MPMSPELAEKLRQHRVRSARPANAAGVWFLAINAVGFGLIAAAGTKWFASVWVIFGTGGTMLLLCLFQQRVHRRAVANLALSCERCGRPLVDCFGSPGVWTQVQGDGSTFTCFHCNEPAEPGPWIPPRE